MISIFLEGYREFYERLYNQSVSYIKNYCKGTGCYENVAGGEADVNYINDYRYYAVTKSTKSLGNIIRMLEAGGYEDSLILARSIYENYLSQRYFECNFDYSLLTDMVTAPIGINMGCFVYRDGALETRKSGETISYDKHSPDDLSIGKDKKYYYDLYSYLCDIAHCNYSQAIGYSDQDRNFVLNSEYNVLEGNIFPLFLFTKLFENAVLSTSTVFNTPEEEKEDADLLVEVTTFLYGELYEMYRSLEKGAITANHTMRDIAYETMKSLKEQTGRVDKTFVYELEKQYNESDSNQA